MKKRFFIMFTIMAISSIVFAADADKYIADLDSQDENTVIQAADWLGANKEKSASKKLATLLTDPRDGVRIHAAQALGYIGDKDYLGSLHNALLNDSHPTVRYAALLSIMKLKDDKSKSTLEKALENEKDPFILDLLTKLDAKDKGN